MQVENAKVRVCDFEDLEDGNCKTMLSEEVVNLLMSCRILPDFT